MFQEWKNERKKERQLVDKMDQSEVEVICISPGPPPLRQLTYKY